MAIKVDDVDGEEQEYPEVPQEVPDVSDIFVEVITEGEGTYGWVHTHGMEKHGLPELEIRGLPLFMAPAAYETLMGICAYMRIPGVEVKLGERMALGSESRIVTFEKLSPIEGEEEHYQYERWTLVDPPEMRGHCVDCGKEHLH